MIRASVLDNPYLSAGDKERFKRKYEGTDKEQQALHGRFAAATGLVYSQFSRDRHVIQASTAADRISGDWRVYGYDYGWNDPRVILEVGKTAYDQLVVLDEYHETESHVEDALAWLVANDKPKGPIYCDHDPSDMEKLTRAGYEARRAAKDIDEGIAEVRKRLETDGIQAIGPSVGDSGGRSPVWGSSSVSVTPPEMSRRTSDVDPDADADTDNDGGPGEGRVGLLTSDRCEHLIREFLAV